MKGSVVARIVGVGLHSFKRRIGEREIYRIKRNFSAGNDEIEYEFLREMGEKRWEGGLSPTRLDIETQAELTSNNLNFFQLLLMSAILH